MSTRPTVSVVTCVYNGDQFVAQAIESILAQSYTDFEYVIVDDGSHDDSYAIAARYAAQDDRIVLLHNDANLGVSRTLNRGIAAAQGDLVMVLDADDLAHPERLALQAALLAAQPDTGAVGCHLEVVDMAGVSAGFYRPPAEPLRMRWELLFRCAIPMGAGCTRRELLTRSGGLLPDFGVSGDYDLLVRLAQKTELSAVPAVLLSYRSHPGQITRVKADRTHWEAMIAAATWWRAWLGLHANLGDVGLVYRGVNGRHLATQAEVDRAGALIRELQRRCVELEAPCHADRVYLDANVARKLAGLQAGLA